MKDDPRARDPLRDRRLSGDAAHRDLLERQHGRVREAHRPDRGTRQRASTPTCSTATRRRKARSSGIPISRTRCGRSRRAAAMPIYKGAIAHTIDAYFKRIGGDLRYEDFAGHHGEWVEPLSVNYRGYDVYELPPNGQGVGGAADAARSSKGFDLKKMGAGSRRHADRDAGSQAARLRGPARNGMPIRLSSKVPIEGLLSDAYADAAAQADRSRAQRQPEHRARRSEAA